MRSVRPRGDSGARTRNLRRSAIELCPQVAGLYGTYRPCMSPLTKAFPSGSESVTRWPSPATTPHHCCTARSRTWNYCLQRTAFCQLNYGASMPAPEASRGGLTDKHGRSANSLSHPVAYRRVCVPPVGLEPTTPGLKARCSAQLSYRGAVTTPTGVGVMTWQEMCHGPACRGKRG